MGTKLFIARQSIWLAWFPLRHRRYSFGFPETRGDGWYFHVAVGPLYLGVGPGTPVP